MILWLASIKTPKIRILHFAYKQLNMGKLTSNKSYVDLVDD